MNVFVSSNEGRAKMFKIAKYVRKERKNIVGLKWVGMKMELLKRKKWKGGEVIFLFAKLDKKVLTRKGI